MSDSFVLTTYNRVGERNTAFYLTSDEDLKDNPPDEMEVENVQVVARFTKEQLINLVSQIESQL